MPSKPPLAFTSSIAIIIPFIIDVPSAAAGPLSIVGAPIIIGSTSSGGGVGSGAAGSGAGATGAAGSAALGKQPLSVGMTSTKARISETGTTSLRSLFLFIKSPSLKFFGFSEA